MSSQESFKYILDLIESEDIIRKNKEPKISFKNTVDYDYLVSDVSALFKEKFNQWKSNLPTNFGAPIKLDPLLDVIQNSKELLLIVVTDPITVSRLYTTIYDLKLTVTKINQEALLHDKILTYIPSKYQISIASREIFNILKIRYKLPFEKIIHYDGIIDLDFIDKSLYFNEKEDVVGTIINERVEINHQNFKRKFNEFSKQDKGSFEFQIEKKTRDREILIPKSKTVEEREVLPPRVKQEKYEEDRSNDGSYVTQCNLLCQKIYKTNPVIDHGMEGKMFTCQIRVLVDPSILSRGTGPNKKSAREEAAKYLLDELKKRNKF